MIKCFCVKLVCVSVVVILCVKSILAHCKPVQFLFPILLLQVSNIFSIVALLWTRCSADRLESLLGELCEIVAGWRH